MQSHAKNLGFSGNLSIETTFITTSVPLNHSPIQLRNSVEEVLRMHGVPLRWAITSVDPIRSTVNVEAVVTQSTSFSLSGTEVQKA